MEPESTCNPKVLGSARSYRKCFSSDVKKGKAPGEPDTEKCSFKKKSQNVNCPLRWSDFKPRASRRRNQFWLDRGNKENKVSENIKTAKELNHVKDSTSTLSDRQGLEEKARKRRLQGLEEKVKKRRLQKQTLANQLLELEEGEIPPSTSPKNDFGSTSDKSDLEEEVTGETKRQTFIDILKDLEEGRIPTRSHCTNDSFQKVSRKGKISMNSQSSGVLDNLVDTENGEIVAGPHNQMLINKLKEGWDDRNCQTGIPQKGLGTSQLTSRDMEEQLTTENEIVQLGKKTERPVTMADDPNCRKRIPQKSDGTSQLRSTDKEVQSKTENEIVQLGKKTERPVTMADDPNCRKGIPQKSDGTSQLRSTDKEEQRKTENEIVQLGQRTERPVTMADDPNCRKGIPQNSDGTSQLRSTDKEEQRKTENEIVQLGQRTERPVTMADDPNCRKGIPQKSDGTSQLRSTDKEEQRKTENEIVQLGQRTERPITMANDLNFRTEIPQKGNRTSQVMPSMEKQLNTTENEIVQMRKETKRPVTTLDGLCFSDSEFKVDKVQSTDVAATCSGSPNVPARASDVLLDRKELSTSPVETVIVVESDTDSDVVELTDRKSVTSTCNVKKKNNEVNSSINGLKDGATRSTSVEKLSPAQNDQISDSVARSSEDPQSTLDEVATVDQAAECSGETIPARNMQNTEVRSYSRNGASRSTSVEKQSVYNNKDIVDSIVQSSENLRSSTHGVIMVDQPVECSSHALPVQEQSAPNEVAVTPVYTESHLQFTGTSTSVVPPDVSAVQSTSITFNQPPIPSVSSSLQSGSLQCPQYVGRHIASPEVQASTQPSSEEAVQLSTPPIVDLQQPQFRSVQTSQNDMHFHGSGSRTNSQDFRSMATSLASMNANLMLPGRAQLLSCDPLHNELERLQKHHEQDLKMHEAMMLHMKCKRDEAIEEIIKKYEILFQDAEAALQHKTTDYKAKFEKVFLNKLLANALIESIRQNNHNREASTSDTRQAASNATNLVQNPTQMPAVRLDHRPPVIAPFRPVINQPSPVPARPFSGHMDCSNGLSQSGYGFRVAAPHLRAVRPTLNSLIFNGGEFIQHSPMSFDNP
ncbi:uncharacterized protein [Euphorbia lathyris]|uniref:uncharacterized protein n=1 Tax=Euphorbia lathyris TaxID=212925 RepID=UPI0033138403